MFKSAIAALLIATGLPVAAGAQDFATARVVHRDLNLASPQGIAAFDRRIARAIDEVCPSPHDISLRRLHEIVECRREAQAQATAQRARLLAAGASGTAIAAAR